jgi:hypothetical protein
VKRLQGPQLRAAIPCGYCFQEWAYCYDHILPVAHGGTNRKSNLYPACRRCNALLSDKVFGSLEEKREYVQTELKARGEWLTSDKMCEMRGGVCAPEEVAEVLHDSLPMATMEPSTSQDLVSYTNEQKRTGRRRSSYSSRTQKKIGSTGIMLWLNPKKPLYLYSKERGYYIP